MEVDKIILGSKEKRLLSKIKKFGFPRSASSRLSDTLLELKRCGLVGICFDERYPKCYDTYGNDEQNAYRVDLSLEKKYRIYRRSKFWPEARSWMALGLSAIAIIISVIALANGQ